MKNYKQGRFWIASHQSDIFIIDFFYLTGEINYDEAIRCTEMNINY